jgi:nucleotide-binding universal stress UspA family protein
MRILLCTDGTPLAESAVRFGASIAQAAGMDATLLGVAASPQAEALVRASVARAQTLFPAHAGEKIRVGRAAGEIIAEAESGAYDLLVAGSRGRRGLARLIFGSVASRLARYARIPALIVKGKPTGVRRVLACTGGDVRGERAARWGGQIARWLDAEITILHVMSQMALSPQSKLDELTETAEQAMAQGTREGRHLARAMELLREQGAAANARPKLRHGLVVDEVAAEAREGDYDLVIIGAHEAPEMPEGWAWLKDYLFDDVADQIISTVNRPVLVVRGQ